jgi:hypothetical protein
LDPEGQFRAQFLCDPTDPEGVLTPPPAAEAPAIVARREFDGEVDEGVLPLLQSDAYSGHVFRVAELRALLVEAGFTRSVFGRSAPEHVCVVAWA